MGKPKKKIKSEPSEEKKKENSTRQHAYFPTKETTTELPREKK